MDIETGAHKIIEVMGVSPSGFDDAVNRAVAKASESINGITRVEVIRQTAEVSDGRVVAYQATVKLAFVVN